MKYSAAAVLTAAAGASAQAAAGCSPLQLVYARATSEPPTSVDNASPSAWETAAGRTWSKGYGAAGYSLYSNVTATIPGSDGYAVHYPASFTGCTSEGKGIDDLVNRLTTQAAKCPQQKFVLGGHSQGGVVVVRALLEKVPATILPKIIAVTMFGSPGCPANVAGKCKSYCNSGDSVCASGSTKGPNSCSGTSGSSSSGGLLSGLLGGGGSSSKASSGSGLSGLLGGKGKAGGSGLSSLFGREAAPLAEPAELVSRQAKPPRPAGCDALAKEEKGHKASGMAHMAYNADGYYIKAATCYIYDKFYAA